MSGIKKIYMYMYLVLLHPFQQSDNVIGVYCKAK